MAAELNPQELEELQLRLQLDNAQTQGNQALVDKLSRDLAFGSYSYSQPSPHLRPTAGEYFVDKTGGLLTEGDASLIDSIMNRLGDPGVMDTRQYRTTPVQDTNYQLGTESMRALGGLLERYVKEPVYGTPTVGGLPYRPDETPSIGGHHMGAIGQMTPELASRVSGMMAMHGIHPQDAGTMLPTESEARGEMASRETQMRSIIDNIQSGVEYGEEQATLTPTQAASPSIVPGLTAGEWSGLQGSAELMLPSILTGIATRGRGLRKLPTAAKAAIPIGTMVPGVLGSETSRLLEEAQTDPQVRRAMSKGEAAALYETIPEALFFGPMAAIKRPLFAFLAGLGGEALSEVLTELGYVADEVVRDGKTFTWEQLKPRLLHAGKMGLYMGGMMGGAITLPTFVENAINNRAATPAYIAKVLRKALVQRKDIDKNTIAVLEGAIEELENPGITLEQFNKIKKALLDKNSGGAFAERRDRPGSLGYDAVFHVDSILASLQESAGNRKVTRVEAKAKALELIGHEVEIHVALKKAIKALNLNEDEINDFYNRMRDENAEAIDAWIAIKDNPYAVYEGEELTPWDKLTLEQQHEQVEEWLANEAKKKTQEGGRFIRFLRKYFKDQVGLDLSTVDATTLVRKLGRQARGEAVPLQPIERPVEATPDTSRADLDAARAERRVEETILDEQVSSLERSTLGDARFAKVPGVSIEDETRLPELEEQLTKNSDQLKSLIRGVVPPGFEGEYSTADRDQDIRTTRDTVATLIEEIGEIRKALMRRDMGMAEDVPQIDNRRKTAIEKATAPNLHIRNSDLRMNAIKEDWENNKNDLDFRRDYANFGVYEQVEWDLNYDMWIDEFQEAELEGATEARVLQENILEEQISGLERDFTGDVRFAKKVSEMNEAEKLNRDVRSDFARGPYKEIVGREDEAEILARIKRLGNLYGPMGQKRGIEPGDRATAKEQAQNAIDNVEAFEEFMAPFEKQMKTQPARSKTAAGRQEKYAERKGITIADILKYRERGKIHPMERKMSYAFANEEIDRLEAEGTITAKEAEARRVKLREFQSELQGRMPPGAKRKVTEIVFGIGDYANIEAWEFTEEQTQKMKERAELAKAKERKTGTRRAVPTEQQAKTITAKKETTEETNILNDMEASIEESMIDYDVNTGEPKYTSWQKLVIGLKDRAGRLRWLREEEQVSTEERDMLDAFKKDPKTFDQETVQARRDVRQPVDETKVTHVEQTPAQRKAELAEMKEAQAPIEKRKHIQVEPDFFETLEDPLFTVQGESIPEGFIELTEDGVLEEVKESDVLYSKKGAEERNALIDAILDRTLSDVQVASKIVVAKKDSELMDKEDFDIIKDINDNYRGIGLKPKSGRYSTVEDDTTITTKARDAHNRKMATKKAKKAEQDHIKMLESISYNLNRVFGNKFMAVEDIVNITRRELEDGEAKGRVMHAEFITEERSVRTADNLIIIPQIFHMVKTLFERAQKGVAFQSAQPYIDMLRVAKDKVLSNKYGIDGTVKIRGVETDISDILDQFIKFKAKLKSEFQEMWDTGTFTYIRLEEAYAKAMEASGVKFTRKTSLNLDRLVKAQDAIEIMVAVGLQKFASQVQHGPPTEIQAKLMHISEGQLPLVAPRVIDEAAGTVALFAKKTSSDPIVMEEHFNNNFWYVLTSYLWGKPVQAIRDFNKLSRFGREKADIPEADVIADNIQRAHAAGQRAEGLKYGTDLMQDTSMKLGEYFTKLYQIFSYATGRLGDLNKRVNKVLVDYLTDNIRLEEIDNADLRESAKMLKEFIQGIYDYAKEQTKHLKNPLNLRGHGDTLLPRVWNIEYLATRVGKAKFIRIIRAAISDPATGSSILEDTDLTIEDLYDVVVNSGGFVQGDWTNLKADQTRSAKDVERDQRAQEHLDSLPTQVLVEAGLVLDDLQAIIPRFVQKAVERVEYAKRFGVNDEILREMIDKALAQIKEHNAKVLKLSKEHQELSWIDPKRFTKAVWDMARILRNKFGYDLANMSTRAFLQRLSNFQVIVKLPLVTLASMPELFTPMLRGDVRFDKWVVDFMMGLSWAGYKGMNGLSKLILNKHLPAMRKKSADIGGIGVVSNAQLLRELGVYEIQSMGDMVSTRYANPNFARGGLRAGARGTIAGKVPKKVRAIFNMQTYMQAVLLTTLTEMQQLMALRNFQRVVIKRIKFIFKNRGKTLTGRKARLYKQFVQDLADYGITEDIDLDTAAGEAAANAGAIRFVDQVITRPNDATTAKAFKNPLTAPIFLFKRFITTFGNTLMTAIGNDFASKVDNVERAKQAGQLIATITAMYGAVMFAEILRGAIKGDLDEDDMTVTGGDFRTFVRRVDRTGLLSAPGAAIVNLAFPYKRGWWDSPEARIFGEFGGPIGGDLAALMKTALDGKPGAWKKLVRQIVPMSKQLIDLPPKKKRSTRPSSSIYGGSTRRKKNRASIY